MGLHETELLDSASVSDTLKCPVCMEVFEDPVFCGGRPCQHVFCRACVEQALERSEQCPSCRAPMSAGDLQPHQVINNLLDEVVVHCELHCGWTGRRDARRAHAAECPKALLEQARAELERFADVDRLLSRHTTRIAELEALVAEKDRIVVKTGQELLAQQVQVKVLEDSKARLTRDLAEARRQLAMATASAVPQELRVPPLQPTSQPGALEAAVAVQPLPATTVAAKDGSILDVEAGWLDPEGFDRGGDESLVQDNSCLPKEAPDDTPWL